METVLFEKKGQITYITLNRPEKLNAINSEMGEELQKTWQRLKEERECRVAILSGAGRTFCSGVAVDELAPAKWSISQSQTMGDRRVGPLRHEVWKPIIAALHGHVVGGGFWLSLECDFRIAADNTVFLLPEAKVGIPTSFAAFLSDFLPRGIAAELLFTGGGMNAERAYQLGVVNKVVPLTDLMEEAEVLAERILQNAPLSIQAMKELMVRGRGLDRQSALSLTEKIYRSVYESEDVREGKKAYLEKRKPFWKGR